MGILNLTQHRSSKEQRNDGVVDLNDADYEQLQELLTFDELPDIGLMYHRAQMIRKLAKNEHNYKHLTVMLGGAPFFMALLERYLYDDGFGHKIVYSFSKRVSEEYTDGDGKVIKTNIFKHIGFVKPIVEIPRG